MEKVNSGSGKKCYNDRKGGTAMTNDAKQARLLKPYQVITDRVIELLEQNLVPWKKPWNSPVLNPKNLHSGKGYRGINVFMLEATGAAAGYRSPYWVTFKQALERGGNVRKGEHATPVVFWKILERAGGKETDADDHDGEETGGRRIPMLKYYNVFNVEQCEGLEYPTVDRIPTIEFDPIAQAEQIVQAMPRPPTIAHKEARAYYAPLRDHLNMPPQETFHSAEEYYCTLFHELTHATGHQSRLNRETITNPNRFGTPAYAREELTAEMGAAFLCGRAGIEQVTLENSAAYIKHWLEKLKNDPKLVVHAAAAAQKASDFILNEKSQEIEQVAKSEGAAKASLTPAQVAHQAYRGR